MRIQREFHFGSESFENAHVFTFQFYRKEVLLRATRPEPKVLLVSRREKQAKKVNIY